MTPAPRIHSARRILHSSETNEWYTPAEIIAVAHEMLAHIDLDPASSPEANEVVKAVNYFTVRDDGLAQFWWGNVWLNCPYGWLNGKSSQMLWSRKLVAEYEAGRVTAALLLVNASTGQDWFQALGRHYPICLLNGRIKFQEPEARRLARLADGMKKAEQPTHCNALVYFGPDVDRFSTVSMRIGMPAGAWQRWPGGAR